MTLAGARHKIDGYVSVDWTNQTEVQVAADIFGALKIGINLPQAWADVSSPGGIWDVTTSGIVGRHDVCCGGLQRAGRADLDMGHHEPAHHDHMGRVPLEQLARRVLRDKLALRLVREQQARGPNGIDAASLASDLAALGGGTVPPLPRPTPPPAPPVPPVPPTPAPTGYTGTVTYSYVGGAIDNITVGAPPDSVQVILKRAGVSPAVIADVLTELAQRLEEQGGTVRYPSPMWCRSRPTSPHETGDFGPWSLVLGHSGRDGDNSSLPE